MASQLFLLYKLYEKSFEVNLESHKGFQMERKKRKNILEKGNELSVYNNMEYLKIIMLRGQTQRTHTVQIHLFKALEKCI